MGLDVEIVKFEKSHFEKHVKTDGAQRYINFSDGVKHRTVLYHYRKHCEVLDAVVDCIGNMDQTSFYELTKGVLEELKKIYIGTMPSNANDMEVFLTAIDGALKETDFDIETIAFTWIS